MEQNINRVTTHTNLDEVSFIRPILIILLVLYHAFAPWCGAWRTPEGFVPNEIYWWIGKAAYSFMLPMFVFISGYVWSYQREALQTRDSLKTLVSKKFRRLYIPSLIFSVAYILMFNPEKVNGGGNLLMASLLKVVGGYAHMWFLPMLFWTFIFVYIILLIKKRYIRWLVVLALCVASMVPFPLRIDRSFYYIVYFYAGYEAFLFRNESKKDYSTSVVLLTWVLFAMLFISLTIADNVIEDWFTQDGIIHRAIGNVVSNFATKIYGFAGIMALFLTSIRYTEQKQMKRITIKLGEYCFGVYLFQQFVLQALYYHTPFSAIVGSQLLPWLGFVITLVVSLLLTYLFRLTKVGRKLI